MQDFLYIGLVLLIAAGVLIYKIYLSGRRRKELAEWAFRNDLAFSAAKNKSFASRYPAFKCLRRGHTRYAYNIMTGAIAGRVFLGCDYHYATGSGKNRHDHLFSLVIVKSPILLEPLFVRREKLLDKFADFVGFDDIDFESAEFSRKFFVKSPNKKWAYDIIHPQMMEFLLSMPEFSFQFDSLSVIIYRDWTFSTTDFEAAVYFANGIFERIPEYVMQNQKLPSV